MGLRFTDEQELLRSSVSRFLASRVAPVVAQNETQPTFPFAILGDLTDFGYVGGQLPEGFAFLAQQIRLRDPHIVGRTCAWLVEMVNPVTGNLGRKSGVYKPAALSNDFPPITAYQTMEPSLGTFEGSAP
jgi:alkylation response protein AidB-like acyl-CoA dehydrogenase